MMDKKEKTEVHLEEIEFTYTCFKCGWGWNPRSKKIPSCCPRCHTYHWQDETVNKGESKK